MGRTLSKAKGSPVGDPFALLLFTAVLFPSGDAAADMALGLVLFKHGFDTEVQIPIHALQTLCDIFMYGAFADGKFLGCAAHRCVVFNHVFCQLAGSLLDICSQKHHSQHSFRRIYYAVLRVLYDK